MEERKELAIRGTQSYIEDIDIAQVKSTMDKIKQFQHVVMSTLEEGQDYGRIAGINKPILFKSGAEKLMMLMGLRTEFDIIDSTRDFQNGFFQYQVKCRVLRGDTVITEGLGSCNTKEARYARRWMSERGLPEGLDKNMLPKREREGKYGKYTEYLIPNEDPYTLDNTVLKMAKKRALIDAALHVGSLSSIVTQDLEDFVDEPELQPVARREPARQQRQEPRQEKQEGDDKVSTAQLKMIHAIMNKLEFDAETARAISKQMFGKESSKDLTKNEASQLIDRLQRMERGEESLPWEFKAQGEQEAQEEQQE